MSYTPTTWTTGDTITASSLNKIEQGIANAGSGGGWKQYIGTSSGGNIELNCSYNDLLADVTAGLVPYVTYSADGWDLCILNCLQINGSDYCAYFGWGFTPMLFTSNSADGNLMFLD